MLKTIQRLRSNGRFPDVIRAEETFDAREDPAYQTIATSSLRYVSEGSEVLTANNRSTISATKSIVYVAAGVRVKPFKNSDVRSHSFLINPPHHCHMPMTLGTAVLPICGIEYKSMIRLLNPTKATFDLGAKLSTILDQYVVNQHECLKRLTQRSESTRKESLYRLTLARQHLDMSIKKRISVEELSKVSFLSKYELIRRFKEAFGETPYNYYLRRKVEATKEDLINGRTMSEIVSIYQFADTFSYSKLFKANVGVSPSKYQTIASQLLQ